MGFSLVVVSRGYSPVAVRGLLIGSGFSCCGAPALGTQGSVVIVRGLSSCGWGLQSIGSVVVVHRLSSSVACLLGSGIEPMSPALAGRFLTTGPSGKSLKFGVV